MKGAVLLTWVCRKVERKLTACKCPSAASGAAALPRPVFPPSRVLWVCFHPVSGSLSLPPSLGGAEPGRTASLQLVQLAVGKPTFGVCIWDVSRDCSSRPHSSMGFLCSSSSSGWLVVRGGHIQVPLMGSCGRIPHGGRAALCLMVGKNGCCPCSLLSRG